MGDRIRRRRVLAIALVAGALVGACGGGSASSSGPSASATSSGVTVRWFVGFGSGAAPTAYSPYLAFRDAYDSSNTDGIRLQLEIVPNANQYDVLKSEIASGNAPDIIGPIGLKGRYGLGDVFLDLSAEVTKHNYDVSDPGVVTCGIICEQPLMGLPYDIYPGYIWYNRDLFDAAGLPYPPKHVGDTYMDKPWNWETVRWLAAQLTRDTRGRHPGDSAFDPTIIAKYGIGFQWADARRLASCWGGGSFISDDLRTAQIPDVWREAFNWYHRAIWSDHVSPDLAAISSALLASSNLQASGNIAMTAAWAWSIGSIASYAATSKVRLWDVAVMPTNAEGVTAAPLDADSFSIIKATKHPDEAFKAMLAIMADQTLMGYFGGVPARTSLQAAYFRKWGADLAEIYPGITVTWSVLVEMAKHPAVPNHESNMPNFNAASNDYGAFFTRLQRDSDFDVNAELEALRHKLQADFDAAAPLAT